MSGAGHWLAWDGQSFELSCRRREQQLTFSVGDRRHTQSVISEGDPVVLRHDGRSIRGVVRVERQRVMVSFEGRTWVLDRVRGGTAAAEASAGGDVEAPMTGTVLEVLCAAGDEVAAGAALVVLEAMKMEHRLTAPAASLVAAVAVAPGDQVDIGQCLVRLDPV